MSNNQKTLSTVQSAQLINELKLRFDKNIGRHDGMNWAAVESRLKTNQQKLWTLAEMENTGGEPDVIGYDVEKDQYLFCDCAAESPSGRRSVCYDKEGLESRKENRPANNAVDMAALMGVELLTEAQYFDLHKLGKFDAKTSSWLKTPAEVRLLGGALFGDYRYGRVFVYHNGAQSYYAARAFRGLLYV